MSQRMWRRGPDGEIIRTPPTAPPAPGPGEDPASPPARKRAHLALGLKLGLRDTYDYLGALLVLSFLFAAATSAGAVGGQGLGVVLFGRLPGLLPLVGVTLTTCAGLTLLASPLAGGVFRFARKAAAREEPDLFDLLWGFRLGLRPSLALGAVQVFGTALLAGNCAFYLAQRTLPFLVLGVSMAYAALFWLAMALYQWPLLLEQEIPVRRVVKKSALLVLDNVPYTLGLLLVCALLTAALAASIIGAILLWAGALAMLTTQSTRELLRKYDLLPPDPTLDPLAGETHELSGRGWHE